MVLVAQLLVPINEPVILPETLSEPVTTKPFGKLTKPSNVLANDAVVANEDDIAFEAQLLVPSKLPVILPLTFNEPVTSNPDGKLIYPLIELA